MGDALAVSRGLHRRGGRRPGPRRVRASGFGRGAPGPKDRSSFNLLAFENAYIAPCQRQSGARKVAEALLPDGLHLGQLQPRRLQLREGGGPGAAGFEKDLLDGLAVVQGEGGVVVLGGFGEGRLLAPDDPQEHGLGPICRVIRATHQINCAHATISSPLQMSQRFVKVDRRTLYEMRELTQELTALQPQSHAQYLLAEMASLIDYADAGSAPSDSAADSALVALREEEIAELSTENGGLREKLFEAGRLIEELQEERVKLSTKLDQVELRRPDQAETAVQTQQSRGFHSPLSCRVEPQPPPPTQQPLQISIPLLKDQQAKLDFLPTYEQDNSFTQHSCYNFSMSQAGQSNCQESLDIEGYLAATDRPAVTAQREKAPGRRQTRLRSRLLAEGLKDLSGGVSSAIGLLGRAAQGLHGWLNSAISKRTRRN